MKPTTVQIKPIVASTYLSNFLASNQFICCNEIRSGCIASLGLEELHHDRSCFRINSPFNFLHLVKYDDPPAKRTNLRLNNPIAIGPRTAIEALEKIMRFSKHFPK